MALSKISLNLKNRVKTSLILFLILFLMLINNYFFGYCLIVIGVFSILEFISIILIIHKKNKIKQLSINLFFITYIFAFCGGLLILSSFLQLKILIFLILITCIGSDIGGYIFGKFFKGPKLSKLSPNKTISGALGSLILSCVTIFFTLYYLTKNFDLLILLIGCLISISCQVGDLFFSFLKRKSNLKDTSNFLPGHGGLLDRVDGILFGLPVGFFTLIMIY
ncbi:phosphatidate cytidylyltransferase [Pelagibacteraceae bacterium]|jgi:phosphatidate cytidylyltransferase|nr:phosphatidate cytidylyltransferase [Pelagibacteraceae bacterium]MDC0366480.1 phosphatidate cytidylyltransferase [Pelagibacteraceae bacterium]